MSNLCNSESDIKFDERYRSEEYGTTTLYFSAPKEMLKMLLAKDYPDAIAMEISIEFPSNHIGADQADVCISPTNTDGEDYDWNDIDLSYDDIDKLILLAEKENN